MADVIVNQNVIRIHRDEEAIAWVARIGPEGSGLEATGPTPDSALANLSLRIHYSGWAFDGSWNPTDHANDDAPAVKLVAAPAAATPAGVAPGAGAGDPGRPA